jgi:hypothetical protein
VDLSCLPRRFEVKPVHPDPEHPEERYYTDDAMAVSFLGHVENLTSERDVIWHRYSVMLGVNTGLLGAIGFLIKSGSPPHWSKPLAAMLFGWLLCLIWRGMTLSTWNIYRNLEELACKLRWTVWEDIEFNPFEFLKQQKEAEAAKGWLAKKVYKDWKFESTTFLCMVNDYSILYRISIIICRPFINERIPN